MTDCEALKVLNGDGSDMEQQLQELLEQYKQKEKEGDASREEPSSDFTKTGDYKQGQQHSEQEPQPASPPGPYDHMIDENNVLSLRPLVAAAVFAVMPSALAR